MPHKKTSHWRWVVLAGLALVTSIGLYSWPWGSEPPVVPAPLAPPRPVPAETIARLEAHAVKTAQQRLEAMPAPVVPQLVGGFPREAVVAVLEGYREMLAVQGLYNQRLVRERQVAHILESPQGAEIASKALADPDFAREAFGDFQAEARFFSVEVLKTAAQKGEERWLLRSADAIAQELSRADDGRTLIDKGRATDLHDLVHAYLDVRGEQTLADGDPQLVRALGFSPTLSDDVKRIYDEIVFLRLKSRFGRERAAEMTATLLGS